MASRRGASPTTAPSLRSRAIRDVPRAAAAGPSAWPCGLERGEAPRLGLHELGQDVVQGARDAPLRIVALQLAQVRDVADVVADAVLLVVAPLQPPAAELLDARDGLEHRHAVLAAAAQV